MPPVTPPPEDGAARRRRYWRSLDELAATPAFRAYLEREFPGGVEAYENTSRRHFLKILGASMALAGLTGCRWPRETILPFAKRPPGRIPGVPQYFATGHELGGVTVGLLVESYDGRPVKVEGNPEHPFNRGAARAVDQALLLEMYDPDRSRTVWQRQGKARRRSDWAAFQQFAAGHFARLRGSGRGLYVLSEASASPALAALRRQLARKLPRAKWLEYEPVSWDHEREGTRLLFGRPHRPQLDLSRADVIVSLECDFLHAHPGALEYAREFARRRRAPGGRMNRLYVAEADYTLTGGMADHRLPLASWRVTGLAAHLVLALREQGVAVPGWSAELEGALRRLAGAAAPQPAWLRRAVADLRARRGAGLVLAGRRQPPAVHALVHLVNHALGNVGRTVHYTADPDPERPSHGEALARLVRDARSGFVETLLLLGGNPLYDGPADLPLKAALERVKVSIHLSLYDNETSAACTWHLPRAHTLEAWGDGRDYRGVHTMIQPLIAPLYGGKTPLELLGWVLGVKPATPYDLVRAAFRERYGAADFDRKWRRALHDGFVAGTAWPFVAPPLRPERLPAAVAAAAGETAALREGGTELILTADPKLHDGRYANNGWLLELPEPVTKLTWENALLAAPATAARLGVRRNGERVRVRVGEREAVLPVFLQPGLAAGSVVGWLGWGRTRAGRVGTGLGVNLYPLRTAGAPDRAAARLEKVPGRVALATTQDHHAMDTRITRRGAAERRALFVREGTLAEYRRRPDFARRVGPEVPAVALWQEFRYDTGHRWGMAIDLTACTGCSACVVACQAENNIPIVGKEEVLRGREMHWLRVDRYYAGPPAAPRMAHQPVPCMQCENAPCEQVCPVGATTHSREGLNDMAYNRCIGTRYCLNNCPFKVRRFNWFLNHRGETLVERMRHNPEVTLRSRGVMEKCTYCVQRIQAVKIRAKNDRRPIRDGEITPACAQTCPTEAIVFGDLNDPRSRVARLHADGRCYGLLDELKVKPRTKYLARLWNPAGKAS